MTTVATRPPDGETGQTGDPRGKDVLRYLSALRSDAESPETAEAGTPEAPQALPEHGPVLVRDVMTPGVVAAHEGALFKEIVAALARNRIASVPVIDLERHVVGVVSESDLLARIAHTSTSLPHGHTGHADLRRKLHALTARDLMSAPAVVATPVMPIRAAAWHAARARVRRMPVIDADGVLVGIVSRGDLLRGFLRPDEDIAADVRVNVIGRSFGYDLDQVRVEVTEGLVRLSGHLTQRYEVEDLVDAVSCVSGVVDVNSDALTYMRDDRR